jgi:hypothetical protein
VPRPSSRAMQGRIRIGVTIRVNDRDIDASPGMKNRSQSRPLQRVTKATKRPIRGAIRGQFAAIASRPLEPSETGRPDRR